MTPFLRSHKIHTIIIFILSFPIKIRARQVVYFYCVAFLLLHTKQQIGSIRIIPIKASPEIKQGAKLQQARLIAARDAVNRSRGAFAAFLRDSRFSNYFLVIFTNKILTQLKYHL